MLRFTLDGQRRAALYDEDYRLRLAVGVGLYTTSADFNDVLAERFGKADSGLKDQARLSQNGRLDVTISRIVPGDDGMTSVKWRDP
jgi:hypothetical protein